MSFRFQVVLVAVVFGLTLVENVSGAERTEVDFHAAVRSLAAKPAVDWWSGASDFANTCNQSEVVLLVKLMEQERSPMGDVFLQNAVQRWGELDGAAAFAYADAVVGGDRIKLVQRALQGWAKQRPLEAWDRLRELSGNYSDRRYELGYALTIIAGQNLSLAVSKFQAVVPERQCLECLAII